ncbi:MAG: IS3 family transposase [Crocinitomicaceae bacterium]|nr:IS3 family transposase [Crocinitomicaceae bacterium]MCO5260899.1 IS3 family transposase [Crocinitomicaceae bacterium]MCO5260943.1 IS3 family transposase [Crocinitomicaceae bacterium]MCO5261038.1 IS3 family transposase [Crocinitomicaceae bacterium]
MVGINRQYYYRSFWIKKEKQQKVNQVISLTNDVRSKMPRIGTRKLYFLLREPLQEMHIGRDKLFKILKANNMLIQPKRSYRITTNSHHRFYKHKNLVEDLVIKRPEQVWVSDITYLGGRDKNCYLALITDAYSKKIMGYDVSNSLATTGTLRALKMAVKNRMYKDKLIHHSDRGIQYCSDNYQEALSKANITPSMTEKYDPYANAVAERINGILKQEFFLEEYNIDLSMMKKVVKDAVSIYNDYRPHYSCHMNTPNKMHRQRKINMRTYKKIKLEELVPPA